MLLALYKNLLSFFLISRENNFSSEFFLSNLRLNWNATQTRFINGDISKHFELCFLATIFFIASLI